MTKKFIFFLIFIFFIFLILHLFGLGGLYYTTIWYDKLLHFLAGLSVFLAAWYLVDLFTRKKSIIFKLLISFLILLVISILWEVFEFLVDTFFQPLYPWQLGINDTLWDLIFDVVGGIIGMNLASVFKKIMIK